MSCELLILSCLLAPVVYTQPPECRKGNVLSSLAFFFSQWFFISTTIELSSDCDVRIRKSVERKWALIHFSIDIFF